MSNLIATIVDNTENDFTKYAPRWSIVNSLCWSAASIISNSYKKRDPEAAEAAMDRGSLLIDVCCDLWTDLGGTKAGFESFFESFVDAYAESEPKIRGLEDPQPVPAETWLTFGFNEAQAALLASKPVPAKKYTAIKKRLTCFSHAQVLKDHQKVMQELRNEYAAALQAQAATSKVILKLGIATEGAMILPEDVEDDIDKKIFDGLERRLDNTNSSIALMAYKQDVEMDEIWGEFEARKEPTYTPDADLDFFVGRVANLALDRFMRDEMRKPMESVLRRINERERSNDPVQEGVMH